MYIYIDTKKPTSMPLNIKTKLNLIFYRTFGNNNHLLAHSYIII